MNVIFVEPFFPSNQRQFVRALAEAGATVIGIGEYGVESFDDDLKNWMHHYERISSVTDVEALTRAVRWVQDKLWVDRMEATIEAHTMAAAQVREACTIPGTSVRTAWLCRDKPSMKEALREAGVPTAASAGVSTSAEAFEFAERVGFPLILKPRSGAGASGTVRVDSADELARALAGFGGADSVAMEEFVEGHEGFYDTITINGSVAMDIGVGAAKTGMLASAAIMAAVAEVPMPSAAMTRAPISRSSPYSGTLSIRLVETNWGEIQRLRIASSTFGK